jgi:hypothetical protein
MFEIHAPHRESTGLHCIGIAGKVASLSGERLLIHLAML